MAKKQKYRLEALLELKKRHKKQTEIRLARAIRQLEEEKKELKKLEEEKKKIIQLEKETKKKMDWEMSSGKGINVGQRYVNFLRKIQEDLEEKEEQILDQKDKVEKATEVLKKAKADYIEACRQLQIMEKHKELWWKKIQKELSRQEEQEMDQLGQTIHALRRWRGEKPVFEL